MGDVKHVSRKENRERKDKESRRGSRDHVRQKRDCESRRSKRENSSDSDEVYVREKYKHKHIDKDKDRTRDRKGERRKKDKVKEKDREVRDRDRKRRRRDDDDHKGKELERNVNSSHRGKDANGENSRKRSGEDDSHKKDKTREEELEGEQKEMDEEVEKKRRRGQEWQELKMKKAEPEQEKLGEVNADELKSGKTWTLEGESDDDEAHPVGNTEADVGMEEDGNSGAKDVGDAMVVDFENGKAAPLSQNGFDASTGDEEIDSLDAFMDSMVIPEVEKISNSVISEIHVHESAVEPVKEERKEKSNSEKPKKGSNRSLGRIIPGEDSDTDSGDLEDDENKLEDEDDEHFLKRVKKTKVEKLAIVDHSKINYTQFRRNFYIEAKELVKMTPEEVAACRKEWELKIHGKDVPKPVKFWHQTGLPGKILQTIKKLNFEEPMPIQAQALPIIMSGRDCIGVAKTGSGKTLAFVLPMLRHIKDQTPVVAGDGPIGLIMAPTRELVWQIHGDIKKFAKVLGIRCVPVYGGSGVAQQISELKRGTEIVVCTPGRMIDILCTSRGKISNLHRVTYLVMDEADRMFDMGFEPQITRIVQNIRPDRQTVLFSATFPRQVEALARKILNKPIEILVGGRSVVNKDITQLVEMRPESERFFRLLELLGEWFEKGKVLIFVQSQEKCDALFRDLLKHGYPCLSLHGAKDQTDRESTIVDFKTNVCNVLIATSIAARGLDVKDLELVVNFDVPNHYEDYVHRVGRTGRAGRKGCAITFVSDEDARYAPDLVKALELSEQVVPEDLKALAGSFMAKVNQGLVQVHGTGYGGSGFKFNEEEEEKRKAAKRAQAKEYGFEEDKSDSEDDDEGIQKADGDTTQQATLAQIAALAADSKACTGSLQTPITDNHLLPNGGLPVSLSGILNANNGAARAVALVAAKNLQKNLAKIQADAMPEHYEAELEINDFPQTARWKIVHKEMLDPISYSTGAAITTRGQHFPQGRVPTNLERKLYLFIEGRTEQSVKSAKAQLKRVLEDITNQALSPRGGAQPGRYSVI